MLQISNLNDVKSEWNLNETHIIIPMVEGDIIQSKDGEKIGKNTITLNALDGTDQTVLTNGVEQTLVIGLDRNIFDSYGNKNDLVFIQNSELKKILPLNAEPKNGITYMVSYTDLSKNEVPWDSLRSKSDWSFTQTEKQDYEVRNILNLNDSIEDSSKNWQECEMEKSNDQIVLEGLDGSGLLNQEQNESGKEAQYFVNYYPTCDTISVLPNAAIINLPKNKIETPVLLDKSKNLELDHTFESTSSINDFIITDSNNLAGVQKTEMTSILKSNQKIIQNVLIPDVKPNVQEEIAKDVTEPKENATFLPEKSLPLKKKAKMKRTLPNVSVILPNNLILEKKEVPTTSNQEKIDNEISDSDSDVPLSVQLSKNRENYNFKKKRKNCDEILEKKTSRTSKRIKLKSKILGNVKTFKDGNNLNVWDKTDRKNFKTIFEVLEDLKGKKLLTDAVVDVLTAGLVEMKTDVLAEMNNICENKSNCYSAQLKAFALMVHFKQPVAYRRLKEVFDDGWPSLDVIKEWKRSLNNSRKPNKNKSLESEKDEET